MNFKKDGFKKTETQIKRAGLMAQSAVNIFETTLVQLRNANEELALLHKDVEANISLVQTKYEADMETLNSQRDLITYRIAHNSEVIKNVESIVVTTKEAE